MGSELDPDKSNPDVKQNKVYRVYRPASEVFAADAMKSFAHVTVTNDHPGRNVTPETWREDAGGMTGGEVIRDGQFVVVPMTLMDAGIIKAYEDDKRELSAGYDAQVTLETGVTDTGETYDAVMRQIRGNHVALVDRARGGEALRIGDHNPQLGVPPVPLKTILVDGIPVEATDAAATVIDTLSKRLETANAATQRVMTEHTTVLAARDATISTLTAERDAARGQVLTDAALDARVTERATLIASAKRIHDADYTGKSVADIRRIAVTAKLGDAKVAGKDATYVAVMFDCMLDAAPAGTDPLAGAPPLRVGDGGDFTMPAAISDADLLKERQAMIDRYKNGGVAPAATH